MAARKMTFSLPSDLANQLVKRVPARERSRFLAQALEKSLQEEDEALIRACLMANVDPDIKAIEQEWDEIRDVIEEPWSDAPAR
jgi:metal-responsive CopG/Arc/MetJ family transcriptional regulator